MSKLLVTGGCGFIGSNFIRHLLMSRDDVTIVNYDALTYAGNLGNLDEFAQHPRYRFVRGDISDRHKVREVMAEGVQSVVHFAAESHVDRSILDTTPFIQTNVMGTQVLIDVAREFKIERFVHVSTDEVYGSLGPTGHFTETTPLSPNSPYAASKASSDLLVLAAVHTFGFPAVITRCSNNYGPYQFPEKLIPLFIKNLLADQSVPVYGDGQQIRDWIHVQDHCRAVEMVWQKGRVGEVYNIGGRSEKANLDLTYLLLDLLGKPRTLIRHVTDRLGHDRRYAIDCSKIEKELGWTPSVRFEQGLADTVAWYRAHQNWVDSVCSGEYKTYYERQYGSTAGR